LRFLFSFHKKKESRYVKIVKLDEGPTVTAQLTDLGEQEVAIGMPVEMVTRRIKDGGQAGHAGVWV
jgi:uncharacterized OB-fold protein